MKFNIKKSWGYVSSGSLDGVVRTLIYEFTESGSSKVSDVFNHEINRYTLECEDVNSEDFIPYDDITVEVYKGWVTASYGENWGSFTSSLESSMSSSLSLRVSSKPTTKYNFHSSSLLLDGLSILSGSDFWAMEIE